MTMFSTIFGSSGIDVTVDNPRDVIYFKGSDGSPEAWRGIIIDPPDKLSFEHFEPLTEADITLDEAKVTSVEGNPIYTSANKYFASVATDSRSDQTQPGGLNGDMTGLFIEWDGFLWQNFPNQWVEKGFFAESFFSDRGIFRRMNVIDTDPNDHTRHPPAPVVGINLGSRNTQADGLGLEVFSFNSEQDQFGQLLGIFHGEAPELVDQIQGIKIDSTLINAPYELAHVAGTNYSIGNVISDQGVRYRCNTDGVQSGIFSAEISKWDAVVINDAYGVYPSDEDSVLNLSLRDIYDRSPFGNDVILEGNAQIVSGAGRIGSGLRLDASSGTIGRVLNDPSLQFTDLLTVEVWVFPNTSGAGFEPQVAKTDSGTGNGWNFTYQGGLRITFRKNNGAGVSDTFSIPATLLTVSEWNHVAMTYDDSTNALRVYVNGDLKDSRTFVATTGTGDGWSDSGDDLILGARLNNGNPINLFDGDMSNVRVYNRVLSGEEIRIHYLRGSNYRTQSAIVADRWKVVDTDGNPWINFNRTNRFPLTHNELTFDIYSRADLIKAAVDSGLVAPFIAPDGISRVPVVALARYNIHETFLWPRIFYPQVIQVNNFEIVDIVSANFSVNILVDGPNEPGGDATTPHFWGRKMSGIGFRDLNVVDVGNFGAGKSTVIHNVVGGGPLSNYIIDFSAFFNCLDMGVIWNMPLFIPSAIISGAGRGLVIHSSSDQTIHSITSTQAISTVAMETPAFSFNGPIANLSWIGGNSRLVNGDSFFGIDDSAASGLYDILGISYGGVALNGDFFEQNDVDLDYLTVGTVDVSVTITGFADSSVNPGVDTTCAIAAYENVKTGQKIRLTGATQGNLNAVHPVVRVADDELSFDINVVFATPSTAKMERSRLTTNGPHRLVEGQTVVLTTGAYAGTYEILTLEGSSGTFVINAENVGFGAGTLEIISKDETSIGLSSIGNGAQKDSKTIGGVVVGGNANVTTISTQNIFVDLNLGTAAAAGNIERFTLTNTTTGELRYDGLNPVSLSVRGLAAASSQGGSQRFNFRALMNGAVLPSPDNIDVPIEVGNRLNAVPLEWAITMDTGDLFRLQVENADGQSDITIDTFKIVIT